MQSVFEIRSKFMKYLSNKCPNCGSELQFDIDSNELKCDYCDTIIDIPEQKSDNVKTPSLCGTRPIDDGNNFKQYECSSCGSRHNTISSNPITRCPSCGSSDLQIVSSTTIRPDNIVPFRVNKDTAARLFGDWLATRRFAPNNLKLMASNKKLTGFYVPAWDFSYDSSTQYEARIETGSGENSRSYRVTGAFSYSSADEYVSANNNYNDNIFDIDKNAYIKNLNVFRPEFLYGFNSSEANISETQAIERLKSKAAFECENYAREDARSKRYGTITHIDCSTSVFNIKSNFNYLPMWVNHYSYNNKNYKCFISGQTGKVTGKSPKSAWKIGFLVAGILAAVVAVALAIMLS